MPKTTQQREHINTTHLVKELKVCALQEGVYIIRARDGVLPAYNTNSVAQPSNNSTAASVTGVILPALLEVDDEEDIVLVFALLPAVAAEEGAAVPVPTKFLSPLTIVVDWMSVTV